MPLKLGIDPGFGAPFKWRIARKGICLILNTQPPEDLNVFNFNQHSVDKGGISNVYSYLPWAQNVNKIELFCE